MLPIGLISIITYFKMSFALDLLYYTGNSILCTSWNLCCHISDWKFHEDTFYTVANQAMITMINQTFIFFFSYCIIESLPSYVSIQSFLLMYLFLHFFVLFFQCLFLNDWHSYWFYKRFQSYFRVSFIKRVLCLGFLSSIIFYRYIYSFQCILTHHCFHFHPLCCSLSFPYISSLFTSLSII